MREAWAGGRSVAWLLDVDDTLLDTAAAMRSAAPRAVAELDEPLTPDETERIAESYCEDPGGAFRRFADGQVSLVASRGERLRTAYECAGIRLPADAGELEVWGRRFEEAFSGPFLAHQRLFPDVEPALAWALATGTRVGLLTNASEALTRAKLRATALATFPFGCVVTRDTLGFGKPDARVFAHAAQVLDPDVARSDIVYVGDEIDVDARAARAAGLCGVLLDRAGRRQASGVPVIASLSELVGAQ